MKNVILSLVLIILSSCGPSSLEDYREEGEGVVRSLIKELKQVNSREDLVRSSPRLQSLFNDLTEVVISAREFQLKKKSAEIPLGDSSASDELREQLNRVCKIPGGLSLIEKAQEEALQKLYKKEKTFTQKKPH